MVLRASSAGFRAAAALTAPRIEIAGVGAVPPASARRRRGENIDLLNELKTERAEALGERGAASLGMKGRSRRGRPVVGLIGDGGRGEERAVPKTRSAKNSGNDVGRDGGRALVEIVALRSLTCVVYADHFLLDLSGKTSEARIVLLRLHPLFRDKERSWRKRKVIVEDRWLMEERCGDVEVPSAGGHGRPAVHVEVHGEENTMLAKEDGLQDKGEV